MRRSRRPQWLRMFWELPLRLVFATVAIVIQIIILMRRYVPATLLLLMATLIPVLAFARSRLDAAGDLLMIAAALALAFAAGALFQRR